MATAAGLHGGDGGRVSGGWPRGLLFSCRSPKLIRPLGVSLLTRLAPEGQGSAGRGCGSAICAVGNGLAGALGLCWDRWPHHATSALLRCCRLVPPRCCCPGGDD